MKAKFEGDLLRVKANFEEVVHSDVLLNFVLFVQFKKREKDPWWSVIFSKAAGFTKSNSPLWVFFTFFKLCKWKETAQRIPYNQVSIV